MTFTIRKAIAADVPALNCLIDASVRGLQAADYTATQIDLALRTVYGADTRLIADGTYFVVEAESAVAGCGGWSRRMTLYGGDQFHGRQDSLLDPRTDAAKIRAFFVDPQWARRGVATMILNACEEAAAGEGFERLEMGATLTGVPFYAARGYIVRERISVALPGGESMPIIRMEKTISGRSSS